MNEETSVLQAIEAGGARFALDIAETADISVLRIHRILDELVRAGRILVCGTTSEGRPVYDIVSAEG